MRNVSVVIPNWNGRELLSEFLPSVLTAINHYRDHYGNEVELLIIDDASTDGSQSWLASNYGHHPLVRVIELQQNMGFLRAVNKGFAEARYPIIFLLNNDVQVAPDAIAPLVSHFDNSQVFAVCSKAYRLGTDFLDGAGKLGLFKRGFWRVFVNYDILPTRLPEYPRPFYSFFGSGAYTAYDASKLAALGGFCELLAPIYWEDVEICYRAWKRGWDVEYEPHSVVHHLSSATMGKDGKRGLRVITERNRLLMTWINLHSRMWFCAHVGWLMLKLVIATLSLDRAYWQSFWQAITRIRAVGQARRKEIEASVRSDREVDAIFTDLAGRAWVSVMLNVKDYAQYVELRRKLEAG
ncbi:MAG: glycosyltransferase family 2 protein [Blastocatellia bacterium]